MPGSKRRLAVETRSATALGSLGRRLGVAEEERAPLAAGFAAFCAALAGYFLLLPLRDEAGVSIGTDKLPRLFVASLFLTFFAAPLVSTFLHQHASRERGVQVLFRAMALSILGFVLLYSAAGPPAPGDPRDQPPGRAAVPGAVPLTPAQLAVRVAFFLHVSLLNVISVSSLWARSADVFSAEQAGRLFGLLGAGATLGQLLGSLAARAAARAPWLGGGGGSPSLLPLLLSAAALELAGQAALRYRLPGKAGSSSGSTSPLAAVAIEAQALPREPSATDLARLGSSKASSPVAGGRRRRPSRPSGPLEQLLGQTLEGYRLIRASPYLLLLCVYLAFNYIVSSSFYFEKSLVVAKVRDAASRTAWFASINSVSAFCILVLQLLATGHALRWLGLPVALSVLPASAAAFMACIALWPTPTTVAAAEVGRKMLSYALARPARESLFTVVSREEKYKAKMLLDTIVQRVGDSLAAVLFQALVPALGFGPSGMALACIPVAAAWAVVAHTLGRRQQRLARLAATEGPSGSHGGGTEQQRQ